MAKTDLGKKTLFLLRQKGFSRLFLRNSNHDLLSFSKALSDAVDYNRRGPYVDKHSPEQLRESGATTFLSRDKMSGVAVWPDGDIRAVFRDERSKVGRAIGELILTALQAGGNKLDCYSGFLSALYPMFGFTPVARVGFDRSCAPDGWSDSFGAPDIIFWTHNHDAFDVVAEKMCTPEYRNWRPSEIQQLPCFPTYEAARGYRDTLLTI